MPAAEHSREKSHHTDGIVKWLCMLRSCCPVCVLPFAGTGKDGKKPEMQRAQCWLRGTGRGISMTNRYGRRESKRQLWCLQEGLMSHCIPRSSFGSVWRMEPSGGIGKETSGNLSVHPMPNMSPTMYTPAGELTESLVLLSTLSSHEGCFQSRTTFSLLPVSSSLSQSATTPPSHAHGGRGEEQTTTTHGQSTPAACHPALDSVTHPAAGMFARPRMS